MPPIDLTPADHVAQVWDYKDEPAATWVAFDRNVEIHGRYYIACSSLDTDMGTRGPRVNCAQLVAEAGIGLHECVDDGIEDLDGQPYCARHAAMNRALPLVES